jgi:hypothetical protein
MVTAEQELEQAFLKLLTLKHVGMALLQFANSIRHTTSVQKDAFGVFGLGFIAFSFPVGEEIIRMHVDVNIKDIGGMDLRWLPLDAEQVFQVCEIKHAGQLSCAARYIENAYNKLLTTRQTFPPSLPLN